MNLHAIHHVVEYTLAQANEIARRGDFTLAKIAYEFCIETETDNSAAWYGLGVVNHQMGDEEGAIVAFERAFLINSSMLQPLQTLQFFWMVEICCWQRDMQIPLWN